MTRARMSTATRELLDAAARGEVRRVVTLLRRGVLRCDTASSSTSVLSDSGTGSDNGKASTNKSEAEMEAAGSDSPECCQYIDPRDYDGRSALHLAAAAGHLNVLRVLVGQGGVEVNAVDRFERTPLQEAARGTTQRHAACARFLQSKGGCSVHRKFGFSLCAAAAAGDLNWLHERQLTLPGLDLGMADYDGRTALHLAAAEGQLAVVRWLVQQPSVMAAVNSMDMMHQTPLDAVNTSDCAVYKSTFSDSTEEGTGPACRRAVVDLITKLCGGLTAKELYERTHTGERERQHMQRSLAYSETL